MTLVMQPRRRRVARTLIVGLTAAIVLATGLPPAAADEAVPEGAVHPESIDDGTSELDHDHSAEAQDAPAPAATRAETRDITFPVRGPVNFTDTFGAPRSGGRLHIGTDIMAGKLQEVVAVDDGEIFWASYGGSNYLYLRGDDGYRYAYIHLNNDSPGTDDGKQCFGASGCVSNAPWVFPSGLRQQIVASGTTKRDPGVRVTRGQHIAWVGDSGNAESTASHLHFEIHVPGSGFPEWEWYSGQPTTAVNPYPSLVAAQNNTGPDGTGTMVLTGDFDADPEDEIFLYGPGTKPDIRYEPVGDLGEFSETATTVNGTYVPLVGDFDGNGYDDILWYAAGSAADYYWYHHSGGYSSVQTRINGTYDPQIGDFDDNGYDDILWYAAGSATDYYWKHNAGGYQNVPTRINGTYAPLVSDFDGNGYDDILWYAAGSAHDFYWKHNADGYDDVVTRINGTYTPFTGDLDGNDQDDIYWYAKGSAADYFWFHSPAGHDSRRSDNPADGRGGSGDFDADGTEEIVWFTDSGVEPDRIWTDAGGQIVEIDASVI